MALFIVGALGCASAPTIEWLIAFRFVQGIGASSVMVIPRPLALSAATLRGRRAALQPAE